ncbi:hypothetical protein GT348_07100 [Aristophania vespae]|uniref:Uncharacterized protein n=1 Tax=Aristophania vespae TaxID=2697033 RepID=A0A6P1NHM0_9PROT|nr:hypothetical protein [Aristophania vespae]QHI96030.1 hypothetical protein GT348_07100 [Aristophania vespae]
MSKAIFLPYQTALMTAMQNHLVTVIATSRRTGMSWVALLLTAKQGLSAKTIEQIMAGAFGVKSHNAPPRSAKSCGAPS